MILMTKSELQSIIDRFNKEKYLYNWKDIKYLDKPNVAFKVIKNNTTNFPDYYDFSGPNEFRYWLSHSEEDTFINNWICPICNTFIENPKFYHFFGYQKGCTKDCRYKIARNKSRETNIKRYGVIAPLQNKEVYKKMQNTCIRKYGVDCIGKSKEIHDKVKETNLKKYGIEYPLQNKEIHDKTIEAGLKNKSYLKAVPKVKKTKLERYGNENYHNAEKSSETKRNWTDEQKSQYVSRVKNTKLKRYGDPNYNNHEQASETKKKNGTLGAEVSKFESNWIEYIRKHYPNYTIITQYKDKRYPWKCDCYIVELDLFIEFQGSYYHNWRPFDNSKEHIEEYNRMLNMSIQKQRIAKNWRYIDTEKREVAKKNNLNFLEYWEKTKEDLPDDPIERWNFLK